LISESNIKLLLNHTNNLIETADVIQN